MGPWSSGWLVYLQCICVCICSFSIVYSIWQCTKDFNYGALRKIIFTIMLLKTEDAFLEIQFEKVMNINLNYVT